MTQVASLLGVLERLQSEKIKVDQSRCVLVRNRNAKCLRCAEACASGCISFNEEEACVVLDLVKCIGCGTCATACPTCALEATSPTDSQLLKSMARAMESAGGEVVVACEGALDRVRGLCDLEKIVSVGCLGRIEESLILALSAMGASEVTLVCAMEGECAYSHGTDTARAVSETANRLFDIWERATRVRVVSKFPASVRLGSDASYDVDKRAFLEKAGGGARRGAAAAVSHAVDETLGVEDAESLRYVKVGADGTLPHFLPNRRRRTLAALRQLGSPQDVMVSTRLWGHVIIDVEACSSCQMCATFCPTAALTKFKLEDGTFGVQHAPSLCSKCRCCQEICPQGAIDISEEVFAVDLLEGVVERFEMKPRPVKASSPHQTRVLMKGLLGCDQVYDR